MTYSEWDIAKCSVKQMLVSIVNTLAGWLGHIETELKPPTVILNIENNLAEIEDIVLIRTLSDIVRKETLFSISEFLITLVVIHSDMKLQSMPKKLWKSLSKMNSLIIVTILKS